MSNKYPDYIAPERIPVDTPDALVDENGQCHFGTFKELHTADHAGNKAAADQHQRHGDQLDLIESLTEKQCRENGDVDRRGVHQHHGGCHRGQLHRKEVGGSGAKQAKANGNKQQ